MKTVRTPPNRDEARAREPVSKCLAERLMVPEVYWGVRWLLLPEVDVLLIDRAGAGDVHAVEIRRDAAKALAVIPQLLKRVRAHYRWIAVFEEGLDSATRAKLLRREGLFPEQGPGCIGVIGVTRSPDGSLEASVLVKAERFPLAARLPTAAFAAKNKPVISFR